MAWLPVVTGLASETETGPLEGISIDQIFAVWLKSE